MKKIIQLLSCFLVILSITLVCHSCKSINSIDSDLNSLVQCKCDDMELEELLEFQESNLPVPLQKKDDENFKILSMKKMKRK